MGANTSTPGQEQDNPTHNANESEQRERATSSDLAGVLAGVEMIKKLEEAHREKLDTITEKRKQLMELVEASKKLGTNNVEAQKEEIEAAKSLNAKLYKEHMDEVNQKKDKELEDLIEHVNTTVLAERRLMMREDVFSSVQRELDDAWQEGVQMMRADQKEALATQTAITTSTYNKKFDEFRMNLDAEYQEALKKRDSAKSRKRGSGIFEWLSPSKRRRADGGDDDDDD